MKKLSLLLAILALLVIAISCADDIILESPPSLQGEYHGVYNYTINYSGTLGSPQTSSVQIDAWKFTETGYNMKVENDPTKLAFCSPYGKYTLSDKVELRQDADGCTGVVANKDLNPEGDFTLRRPADSVIMTQINTDKDAFIEIKLARNQ